MMKRTEKSCRSKVFKTVLAMAMVMSTSILSAFGQADLGAIFVDPPDDAKPRGYWIWAHGNFDYATMKKELRAFHEMGLGGVDIFDMGIADPYDMIPPGNTFMGDEMVEGIAYALEEAAKYNLKMGLSVSNGWNAGGDWTTADEKLMRLLFWKDTVQGPVKIREVGFPEVPVTFEKPYGSYALFPTFDQDGFPEFYENVALVAYPLSSSKMIADFDEIKYFDPSKIEGNAVDIELPAGEWILTRAVVTPLGQRMWMRSDNSNGFIMDHYAKSATKHHFEHIIDKLETRIGDLGASALERLYLASFEAEDYVIWSPELREAFYEQHGYEIDPYIPILTGIEVVSDDITERFLHDYRSTVSEMFIHNHYRQASNICREHGMLLASESGGPGPPLHYVPTEDLKALGSVDIMRGEFWNAHDRYEKEIRWRDKNGNNLMQVVKNIGSAAHIYGHKVVEMEAFTSHSKHWQETPFELKALADRAFCEGMTRVVYHTMPHSPPEAGVPGWSYQAGTHVHPKMTWWPMSDVFHRYLARCGAMLMQGHFVADVAYFYGSEVPNFATTKYVRPDLGPGYDYDDLNTEVLLQIEEVKDGRIVLPGGMEYEVLVLPEDRRMKLEVLRKVEELLQKGATIIGPRPSRIYGLKDYREKEEELNNLADRIWGKSRKWKKIDKNYGQGRIIWGVNTRDVLLEKGVYPDLQYEGQRENPVLDYIHRTTELGQIYFIRNMDSVDIHIEPIFRIKGMQPELWDPLTGEMKIIPVFKEAQQGIRIPLELDPLGSVFVVFRNTINKDYVETIRVGDQVKFPSDDRSPKGFSLEYVQDDQLNFFASAPGTYRLELSNEEEVSVEAAGLVTKNFLAGSWDVRFPYGWGVDPLMQFSALMDWTSSEIDDLKHFSGKATYRKTFSFEEDPEATGERYFIDLGQVGAVARVYLNGKEVGTSIFPPHELEVTKSIREGQNHLVIEVANTWLNRLIGDVDKPLNQQYTHSNLGVKGAPHNRPWRGQKLQPSGLIGPVYVESLQGIRIK